MEMITYTTIMVILFTGSLGLVYLFRLGFDIVESIIKFERSRITIKTKEIKMKYYEVFE